MSVRSPAYNVPRAAAFLFIGIWVLLLSSIPGEGGVGSASAADVSEAASRRNPELLDMRGEKVFLRSFLGHKPLIVVFWATWCPLCRAEVPTLNRLAADPRIQVLAVNLGDNEQKVQSFVSSFHVDYTVVRDPGWQSSATYQVLGIPACILLDKEGQILYRGSTLPENIEAYLRR